jgi:hypothetical protein
MVASQLPSSQSQGRDALSGLRHPLNLSHKTPFTGHCYPQILLKIPFSFMTANRTDQAQQPRTEEPNGSGYWD